MTYPAGKSKFRCRINFKISMLIFQHIFEVFSTPNKKTSKYRCRFDVEKALKNVRIFRCGNFDVECPLGNFWYQNLCMLDEGVYQKQAPLNNIKHIKWEALCRQHGICVDHFVKLYPLTCTQCALH